MVNNTPNVLNVALSTANTEVEQTFTGRPRAFSVQCRTAAVLRVAFETGKVATPTAPFATIKSGTAYTIDGLSGKGGFSLFLASSTADVVAEIIEWR